MAFNLQQIVQNAINAVVNAGAAGSSKTPASQKGGSSGNAAPSASKGSAKATSYSYTGKSTSSSSKKSSSSSTSKGSGSSSGGGSNGRTAQSATRENYLADYEVKSAVERAGDIVGGLGSDSKSKLVGYDMLDWEADEAQNKAKNAEKNYLDTLEKSGYNAGDAKVKSAKQMLDDALREAKIYSAASKNAPHAVSDETSERVVNAAKGGALNYAASIINAAGTAYEGGARGQENQTQIELAELEQRKNNADAVYEETLAKYEGDTENPNVKAAQSYVDDVQRDIDVRQNIDYRKLDPISQSIYDKADTIGGKGAEAIASAKEGLGKGGQLAVDVGVAGTQLLLDAATGRLMGGGTLPLLARSFGGAAQEARQAGASYEQQALYAAGTAAVEVATEKLFDGLAGLYGKGFADGKVGAQLAKTKLVEKLSQTQAGNAVLKILGSMSGEAAEEAIANAAGAALQMIYNGQSYGENFDITELLYDALIGGILGGAGGTVSLASYQAPQSANNAPETIDNEITPAITQKAGDGTSGEFNTQDNIEALPQNAEVEANAPENDILQPVSEPLANTQDRVFESVLTEEEGQMPGLSPEEAKHTRHSDAIIDQQAKARLAQNPEREREKLLSAGSWTDEDTATAGYLIQSEIETARNAATEQERVEAYKRLAELKAQWNKQGTEEGRALRQRRRFVSEDVVATAAETLYGEQSGKNVKALRKLSPKAKDSIMQNVSSFAKRYNGIAPGDTASLVSLIKSVSVARRTTGLLSKENGKAVNFALEEVSKQQGGEAFLRELAAAQIKSIASDYVNPGIITQIKSLRFMNMLSNPATTATNVSSNLAFGSFMEMLSGNAALPFDMLMARFTGKREIAGDPGAFSKTKWKGSYDAAMRSFLEVSLDAETEQANYGYKELKGGTFKMTGNTLERFLATIQKYQGYALKTTDQAAKGGTVATTKEGLENLASQGKAKAEDIDAIAKQTAEYRTLQTESKLARATGQIRKALDDVAHIGNEKTGTYGLGTDIAPFASVPANSVVTMLEYNPAIGVSAAVYNTAKVIWDAKNGTLEPGQQANAARGWGRAIEGTALIALAAAMTAKGLIQDFEDEDKDVNAQRIAEGKSGLQWNISGTLRYLTGQDSTERESDLWVNFAWLPSLNALMNLGADVYSAYTEDGKLSPAEIGAASWNAAVDAFMDFPAVSKISSLINTAKYSENEGWAKAGEVVATSAAETASSILIPNAARAVAAGLDEYERDIYSADSYVQDIINNAVSGVPILREKVLEPRLDNFGQPVQNAGGVLNFLDRVIFPGNYSRHDRQSEASKIVEDIYEQTGDPSVMPDRNAPYEVKIDGESVELTDAERREYQKTTGNKIIDLVLQVAQIPGFSSSSPQAQSEAVKAVNNFAEDRAKAELAGKRGLEYDSDKQRLLDGVDKPGEANDIPALESKNAGEYIAFNSLYDSATAAGDYAALDNLVAQYAELDENTRAVIDEKSPDGLKNLIKFAEAGSGSEAYYKIKAAKTTAKEQLDIANENGGSDMLAIVLADIPEEERLRLIDSGAYTITKGRKQTLDILRSYGCTVENAYKFFDDADWSYNKDTGAYESNGTLYPLEAAAAIRKLDIPENEKPILYEAFKAAMHNPNPKFDNWGSWTYADEIAYLDRTGYKYGKGNAVTITGNNPIKPLEIDAESSSGGGRIYGGRSWRRSGSAKPADLGDSVSAVRSIANKGTTGGSSSNYLDKALRQYISAAANKPSAEPAVNWETLLAGYIKNARR